MKEINYLKIINKELSDNSFLGDDCAFIKPELMGTKGLYITQDTLVENVHFTPESVTPYQLGKKAVNINLSDLAANCAKPLFLTISLSLPKTTNESFVEDFYKGINKICETQNIKVIGGDITGSDKIMVSICAIGQKISNITISRKFAKINDVVFVTGFHGDSAGGLKQLLAGKKNTYLTDSHLNPKAQLEKSIELLKTAEVENIKEFAMMDTSDGLADAMYRIAKDSNVSIDCDFKKIPISNELKNEYPNIFPDLVLWGGEDFQLLGCIEPNVFEKLNKNNFFKIGTVQAKNNNFFVKINLENDTILIDQNVYESKSFNHFEDIK